MEWVTIDSLTAAQPPPWLGIEPGTIAGGEFTVRNAQGHLVGRLHAAIDLTSFRVVGANWNPLGRDEIIAAARDLASSYFPGWSNDMQLIAEGRSPESFDQAMSVFPESVTLLRWAEKRDGAWTGSYVQVSVRDRVPRVLVQYGGYVARPRSIEEVAVTEEEAIAVAVAEAERQGLADVQVKQVDLYLDHQVRHFPHYIVIVAEPEPRGELAMHPLQIDVIVHGITGEVVPASAGYPAAPE